MTSGFDNRNFTDKTMTNIYITRQYVFCDFDATLPQINRLGVKRDV